MLYTPDYIFLPVQTVKRISKLPIIFCREKHISHTHCNENDSTPRSINGMNIKNVQSPDLITATGLLRLPPLRTTKIETTKPVPVMTRAKVNDGPCSKLTFQQNTGLARQLAAIRSYVFKYGNAEV